MKRNLIIFAILLFTGLIFKNSFWGVLFILGAFIFLVWSLSAYFKIENRGAIVKSIFTTFALAVAGLVALILSESPKRTRTTTEKGKSGTSSGGEKAEPPKQTINLGSCPGKRNNVRCGYPLRKCSNCGNVGCQKESCSNCAFTNFKCNKCGKSW